MLYNIFQQNIKSHFRKGYYHETRHFPRPALRLRILRARRNHQRRRKRSLRAPRNRQPRVQMQKIRLRPPQARSQASSSASEAV